MFNLLYNLRLLLTLVRNLIVLRSKKLDIVNLNSTLSIHVGLINSVHFSRFIVKIHEIVDSPHVIIQAAEHSIPSENILDLALTRNSNIYFVYNKRFFLDYIYNSFYSKSSKPLPFYIKLIPLLRKGKYISQEKSLIELLLAINRKNLIIYAHQLQSAGRLLYSVLQDINVTPKKLVYLCYGSDIYFFQHNSLEKSRISNFLNIVTHALVECSRDSVLIKSFNNNIDVGPIFPNSWINYDDLDLRQKNFLGKQKKKQIVVKGYQDFLGRVQSILDAIIILKDRLKDFEFIFLSTSPEFRHKTLIPLMDFSELTYKAYSYFELSSDQTYDLLCESKIFIASSVSDGIATTNLEAYLLGNIVLYSDSSQFSEYVSGNNRIYSYKHWDIEEIKNSLIQAITHENEACSSSIDISKSLDSLKSLEIIRIKWLQDLYI